ncbi:DUF4326 domain-containing protein [Streptomyces thermocarboxydovorans]|uniref:DUF4326 domain-containing protein n=1 Tax=Streptomyces thermocarboxydovorans TaxID=59298 RepID=A0ABN1HC34_9ACTN
MNAPTRIQRRRTKGWRKPEGAVYVGRGTRFGNPARIAPANDHNSGLLVIWEPNGMPVGTWPADGREARRYATELYRFWITQPEQADTLRMFRELLRGRDLMCWCPPDEPCHADVLLALANEEVAS